jgi:hypothetical protein
MGNNSADVCHQPLLTPMATDLATNLAQSTLALIDLHRDYGTLTGDLTTERAAIHRTLPLDPSLSISGRELAVSSNERVANFTRDSTYLRGDIEALKLRISTITTLLTLGHTEWPL